MTLSRVCPGVTMTQVVELQNRHSRYWYPYIRFILKPEMMKPQRNTIRERHE